MGRRISKLSFNEEICNRHISKYKSALNDAEYNNKLNYLQYDKFKYNSVNTHNLHKNNKKYIKYKDIIYKTSMVNVTLLKKFYSIINKHFNKTNKYHQVINFKILDLDIV